MMNKNVDQNRYEKLSLTDRGPRSAIKYLNIPKSSRVPNGNGKFSVSAFFSSFALKQIKLL